MSLSQGVTYNIITQAYTFRYYKICTTYGEPTVRHIYRPLYEHYICLISEPTVLLSICLYDNIKLGAIVAIVREAIV